MEKRPIYWSEDSFRLVSIHKNEKHLTLKESYLGHITFAENKWWYKLNEQEDLHGPYDSSGKAREALKQAVNGEEVDEWYALRGWRS